MENWNNLFGYESLAFFGKVNASISHELKNILAIISETAGLLGDLSEMARDGSVIEPDMLTKSTESIIEEIQRGFATIRQMNRFSHSVDIPVASVNLIDILELVRNISGYLSFTGKIQLSFGMEDAPLVSTCPFILQAVIYQTLVSAFQNAGQGAELDISIQPRGDSAWRILFYGFSINDFEVFPDEGIKRMAESIGVSMHWDRTADRLEIHVPVSIQTDALQSVSPQIPDGGNILRD